MVTTRPLFSGHAVKDPTCSLDKENFLLNGWHTYKTIWYIGLSLRVKNPNLMSHTPRSKLLVLELICMYTMQIRISLESNICFTTTLKFPKDFYVSQAFLVSQALFSSIISNNNIADKARF